MYKADFTPKFFQVFELYRGYDLRPHMNLLLDRNDNEISNRIRSDYRETLSDLLVDGFNPVWNETFVFELSSPDTAIILFKVADKDFKGSEFIAQYAIRACNIRSGYRAIPLCKEDGNMLDSAFLFVNITLQTTAAE